MQIYAFLIFISIFVQEKHNIFTIMKKHISLLALIAITLFSSTSASGKKPDYQLQNNAIEFVDEGIDIALSYPQLIFNVDVKSEGYLVLAKNINEDACRTISAVATNSPEGDDQSYRMCSPELMELYALQEARKNADDLASIGATAAYDLYSQWEAYANDHIVSIFQKVYKYSGGAHGSTFVSVNNYLKKTGKRFKFNTIIEDKDAFMELVVKYMCRDHSLKPTDPKTQTGLFFELADLPFPQEVGITKKGIVAVYQQYEIAPYSYGVIAVVIPFRELKDLLDKSFFDVVSARGGAEMYDKHLEK